MSSYLKVHFIKYVIEKKIHYNYTFLDKKNVSISVSEETSNHTQLYVKSTVQTVFSFIMQT